MRWLFVLALALAQTPQASSPVIIDVTVAGRSAASLANLSAADFEVDFNGQAQAVRAAEKRPASATTEMAGAVGPVFDAAPMPPSAVYRLSIDVSAGVKPDAAVNVGLRRADLSVLGARRASMAPPAASSNAPSTTGSLADRAREAVERGRISPGIPLAVGRSTRRAPDRSQVTLDVALDLPPGTPGPVYVTLGVVDARGSIRSVNRTLDATNHLDVALPLTPGAYKLRIVALGGMSGTAGGVELPVNAQLGQIGTMTASDLLRSTADSTDKRRAITNDTIPAGAETLIVGLELYPPADGPPADLLLNISLTPEGTNTPAVERVVAAEPRDGALLAEAEFGIQRLAAGRYVARAVVLSGARPLGTVEAIIKR